MTSALRANSSDLGSIVEWSGMASDRFMVRRNPALGLASWCHWAAV
jgi:hypothetical protein